MERFNQWRQTEEANPKNAPFMDNRASGSRQVAAE
jgi:hypothetical protein